jgi:hypothetical protein
VAAYKFYTQIMHSLFTYRQGLIKNFTALAAAFLLVHILVMVPFIQRAPDAASHLAATYGEEVAICKGDRIVYIKWSQLPKEHLPIFSSLIEGGILPSLFACVILVAVMVLGAALWPCLFNSARIPQGQLAERWLYWHRLLAHAPPR